MILGIDEVGRGSLAGPVTMTGVLLPDTFPLLCNHFEAFTTHKDFTFIRDSKILKPALREQVESLCQLNKLKFLTISASPQLIDTYGIGVCLSHISAILCCSLGNSSTRIIIDGKIKLLETLDNNLLAKIYHQNQLPELKTSFKGHNIHRENKADDKYLSVAIASNIAKVHRDNYMTNLSQEFPEFSWQKNKGYGTLANRQAIYKNPKNPHLRQTFITNTKKKPLIKGVHKPI
jgi:ribonuclease HII